MTNTKLNLICVAAVAMLAACGGGGGGDDTTTNPGNPGGSPGTQPADPGVINTVNAPGEYADSNAKYAYETINKIRGITGVGYLKQNGILDKAAKAHADYLIANGIIGHDETPGRYGFTGITPLDRAQYFGWSGGNVGESVGSGYNDNSVSSVWSLLGVPYHARHLLGAADDIGIAWSIDSNRSVLPVLTNYASSKQKLPADFVAVFPCNDVRVNLGRQGYETPNPGIMGDKVGWGYTTMAIVRQGQRIEITSWELKDASGNTIPTKVMTQANDAHGYFAQNEAALIPVDALPKMERSYTSVLKGKNNGVPFEKSCTWRSVAGDTVPQN